MSDYALEVNAEVDRICAALEKESIEDHEEPSWAASGQALDPKVADRRAKQEWARRGSGLPGEVVTLFERIRKEGLRVEAFHRAEEAVLWGAHRLDNERRERLWRAACRDPRRHQTLATVRKAIDATLSVMPYNVRIYKHDAPAALPARLRRVRAINGWVVVNEPKKRNPSFGVPAYPEWTPPEVIVIAVEQLRRRLRRRRLPWRLAVWDPTAGSGTVRDVVRVMKGACASSDLCSLGEGVVTISVQSIGTSVYHTGKNRLEGRWGRLGLHFEDWDLVVRSPTLIFLDPPSRGWPTMTGLTMDPTGAALDLAGFERDDYIEAVASAASKAVECLAPGGLVSLVIREGTRHDQRVMEDPRIAEDIIGALSSQVGIYQGHRIRHGVIYNQASLGSSRLPMRHLLLEKRGA